MEILWEFSSHGNPIYYNYSGIEMNRLGKRRDPKPVLPVPKSSKAQDVELYISNPPFPTLILSGLKHLACAYNNKSDLLLVFGHTPQFSYHILTTEGYLVTKVNLGYAGNLVEYTATLCASFTDEQILIEIFKYYLFLSTDYRIDLISHKGSVFDCDDNGNIYFGMNHERRIAIHSSDFGFKCNFPEFPTRTGEMVALAIRGDLMAVLTESSKYSVSGWDELLEIHKYSLTTGKLIQKCIISDFCRKTTVPDLFCIDKSGNILSIEQRNSQRYCILYTDGSVCSYTLGDNIPKIFIPAGITITNNLELILVYRGEYIGVYNVSNNQKFNVFDFLVV